MSENVNFKDIVDDQNAHEKAGDIDDTCNC